MALSSQYQKDLNYLMEKSNKGTLKSNDAIFKNLSAKAKNLPELQRALNSLRVNHV